MESYLREVAHKSVLTEKEIILWTTVYYKTEQYLFFHDDVAWHVIFMEKRNQNHPNPPFHPKILIFRTSPTTNQSPDFKFFFLWVIQPRDNFLILVLSIACNMWSPLRWRIP
jgi:hypothetical protein